MSDTEVTACLKELGMPDDVVEEFALCARRGDLGGELRILSRCREERVQAMHGIYKDLECLDYLIAQIQKERARRGAEQTGT